MTAGRHSLFWLVAGNAAGFWLSLLLLFPELQSGELTYGRWVPVHLDIQLYGWTAMPLVGWLLSIYGVSRRWSSAAVWGWSSALAVGVFGWLGGGSGGKIFLDWKGAALAAFVAALLFLWGILLVAWIRRSAGWAPRKRWLSLGGLALLAFVPPGMIHASSPEVYPPVDITTGGPTGASLLGSTLVVVALLMILPRSFGLGRGRRSTVWPAVSLMGLSAAVFACAEWRGGTHRDLLQITAMGLLLPWPWLIARDWLAFAWPERSRVWCAMVFFWWALLVASGFVMFLPGVLDHLKFTNALVAHSHLAMAGFTTSFCALLLRLTGNRFGSGASASLWHIGALAMILVLAATGWMEGSRPGWLIGDAGWRFILYGLRALCGLLMLAASIHWLASWKAVPRTDPAASAPDETSDTSLQPAGGVDGYRHRPASGYFSKVDPQSAGDSGSGPGWLGLSGLDRGLRGMRRSFIRAMSARGRRGRNGVDLHRAGPQRGGPVPDREDRDGRVARSLADGGDGGCLGGDHPMDRPEGKVVATARTLIVPLRAAGVIAAVYAHFLIFAQFAWVEEMRAAGSSAGFERFALGTMAFAGVLSGFLVSRRPPSVGWIRVSLGIAALSAAVSPFAAAVPAALMISVLTGASIGVMTVSMAALLPAWCGVAWLGLGTGLGYALCNLPAIFLAPPARQAWWGAAFAILGALVLPSDAPPRPIKSQPAGLPPAVAVVVAFTALVWLDSAAFFIIQHNLDLKSVTWGGPMLWRNAALHLIAALAAGALLKRGFRGILTAAWAILAVAAFAANLTASRPTAGWWYPAGVSLYSTALVAWPGFFTRDASPRSAACRAAWLYAVAGWFGSANGIGMVQSLQKIPPAFVFFAGTAVLLAMFFRRSDWPSWVVGGSACMAAWGFSRPTILSLDRVERGRQVYISEGCIHCHSRYVRQGSPDVVPWGPALAPSNVLSERPVLIGNRRQGPDLLNVGLRRSATWLKLHFLNPRDFAEGSSMPSYASLFSDSRGEDLIAFLQAPREGSFESRIAAISGWIPAATTIGSDGQKLFARHCGICHGPEGHGNGKLAPLLAKPPPSLHSGPFVWTPSGDGAESRMARVVKFGVPGTEMPGHETLGDGEVAALVAYLKRIRSHGTVER